MQLANLTLRLGGSLLNTVPKIGVTPAEILVLKRIHGEDAVVDVRPGKVNRAIRHEAEYERLASIYDRAASSNDPGDDRKSILAELFPGAMKKLPTTLAEVGLGHLETKEAKAAMKLADAAVAPDPTDSTEPKINLVPDLEGNVFAAPAAETDNSEDD